MTLFDGHRRGAGCYSTASLMVDGASGTRIFAGCRRGGGAKQRDGPPLPSLLVTFEVKG